MKYHFNTPSPPQILVLENQKHRTEGEGERCLRLQVTQEMKANAEVYYGDETCREKLTLLLEEKRLAIWLVDFARHTGIVDSLRILAMSGSDIKKKTCTSLRMSSSAMTLKLQIISSQTRSRIRLVSKPRSSYFGSP